MLHTPTPTAIHVSVHALISWPDFFFNITTDIGFDQFRCDCHRQPIHMAGWYETYYYFNREFNFNITYSVSSAIFNGAHAPMGYYPVESRNRTELYQDLSSSVAFQGQDSEPVVNALLEHLGQVDELFIASGGLWSMYWLSTIHPPV